MANVTVAGNCIVFVDDVECIHIRACSSNRFNGVLNSNSNSLYPVPISHYTADVTN